MPSKNYSSILLSSPTTTRLGRLTLSPLAPNQGYIDPPTPPIDSTNSGSKSRIDFTERISTRSAAAIKFRTRIISLLTADASKSTSIAIAAPMSTTHSLENSGEYFKAACANPDVRKWLWDEAFEAGINVYLVVGYHTVVDAVVTEQVSGVGGGGMVGVEVGREREDKRSYTVPGESVYAVQYRKVKFRWGWSSKLRQARLERDNRWKILADVRGGAQGDDTDVINTALVGDNYEDSDLEDKHEDISDKREERKASSSDEDSGYNEECEASNSDEGPWEKEDSDSGEDEFEIWPKEDEWILEGKK